MVSVNFCMIQLKDVGLVSLHWMRSWLQIDGSERGGARQSEEQRTPRLHPATARDTPPH